MAKYVTSEFERVNDHGRTVEFDTDEWPRRTLAYLDFYEDGCEVTVFDPGYSNRRTYDTRRPEEKARAIIKRHLDKLGYTTEVTND